MFLKCVAILLLSWMSNTLSASESANPDEIPSALYRLTQGGFEISLDDQYKNTHILVSFANQQKSKSPMLQDLLSIQELFNEQIIEWRGRKIKKYYFTKSKMSTAQKGAINRLCSPASYWQDTDRPADTLIPLEHLKTIFAFQFAGRLAYELNLLFTTQEQELLMKEDPELAQLADRTNPHRFYRTILAKNTIYAHCHKALAAVASIEISLAPENFLLYHARKL